MIRPFNNKSKENKYSPVLAYLPFFQIVCILLLCMSFYTSAAQSIDSVELEDQIANLNDSHKYEEAILALESIISNPKSTHYDRSNAYIQKALTYKRLYNYNLALNNLDQAFTESLLIPEHRKEVQTRILVERMFVYFDLQRNEEFQELLDQIDQKDLKYIKRETTAFFKSVLGIIAMRKKDYKEAEQLFDEAITILEKENPKHLPNVYRAKIVLYGELKNHDKAMEAFDTGMSYANQYNSDIYKIIMYEAATLYYRQKGDYKNALAFQEKVSTQRTKYNANNVIGNLNLLEKDLLQQRKNLELELEKKIRYYLMAIAAILVILLITLWKLLLTSKQKRKLIEKENDRVRKAIEQLTNTETVKSNIAIDRNTYGLTERQLEVINLVKLGKTNKQIGAELFISENTVKYHLKTIYDKIGIVSRSELGSISSNP